MHVLLAQGKTKTCCRELQRVWSAGGCSVSLTGDKAASILKVASDWASLDPPKDSMLLLPVHSKASCSVTPYYMSIQFGTRA